MRDFSVKSERVHSINQLLKAYAMFEKDVEYIIQDSKVKIVDEQTGRVMDGRRYSDGLHQAIEAKENVKVEAATQTFATITLQNFFRMYHKLSGMTGTAETEAGELWEIYKLDVVVIPTNRPIARDDREDLVYKTVREKLKLGLWSIDLMVDKSGDCWVAEINSASGMAADKMARVYVAVYEDFYGEKLPQEFKTYLNEEYIRPIYKINLKENEDQIKRSKGRVNYQDVIDGRETII